MLIDKKRGFGWNARMMIWMGLIIIVAWSFSRVAGRGDCIEGEMVKSLAIVGDSQLKQIAHCSENAAYDFKTGRYGADLLAVNPNIKELVFKSLPVEVVLDVKDTSRYEIESHRVILGRDVFAGNLARALVESSRSWPKGFSRNFYVDLYTEAFGGRSGLFKSNSLVYFLGLPDCGSKSHLFCQSGYSDQEMRTLSQRGSVLAHWKLFYVGLSEAERQLFQKLLERAPDLKPLEALDFSGVLSLRESYRKLLGDMGRSFLDVALMSKFEGFLESALRLQFRNEELVADYLVASPEEIRPDIGLFSLLTLKEDQIWSPVLLQPIEVGTLSIKFRYLITCMDGKIKTPKWKPRRWIQIECTSSRWESLQSGYLKTFLAQNPEKPFVQIYLPSLTSEYEFEFQSGNAADSNVNGNPLESLQWVDEMKAYKVNDSKSAFLEFFRPPKGRESILILNP